MKKSMIYLALMLVVIALTACGPSSEEIATLTAAEWTATPLPTNTPTPTATPIPYDLDLNITDGDGNSLSGALIVFPASGNDEPVISDENGNFAWSNLSSNGGMLKISSQGYSTQEYPLSLERGANEITVALEIDPLQILPSEACQAGQDVLYIEDFEDSQAQGWNTSRPAWVFEESEELGTYLSKPLAESTYIENSVNYQGNTLWLFDLAFSSNAGLIWIEPRVASEGIYYVLFADGGVGIQKENDQGVRSIADMVRIPSLTEVDWRHVAIALFDGAIDVWIDGKLLIGGNDAEPLENGKLAIEAMDNQAPISFDNFVLCSLSEPYNPPVVEPAE